MHNNIVTGTISKTFIFFFLEHAKAVKYPYLERQVIDEDVIKAIKFKPTMKIKHGRR
jgi:hypothetical protein